MCDGRRCFLDSFKLGVTARYGMFWSWEASHCWLDIKQLKRRWTRNCRATSVVEQRSQGGQPAAAVPAQPFASCPLHKSLITGAFPSVIRTRNLRLKNPRTVFRHQ